MPANREWTAEKSASGGTELITLYENTKPLTFRSFFGMLQDDADYANWYTDLLKRSPFNAWFWEHPPLTVSSIDDEAEFVMIDAPTLERMPVDANAFRSYFTGDEVVTFQSLGGDATLIAPSPGKSLAPYPHLAAFLRNSTEEKAAELWRNVGQAIHNSLSNKAVWLSTSGLGVAWLHIRLDSTPKYYQHQPYKSLAAAHFPGSRRSSQIVEMKQSAMWVLTLLGLIYVGFCGYLYAAQRSFIYFPVPESRNVLAEDLRLDVQGANLQIWRLHAEKREALIYFGGNAEDVAQNIQQFSHLFPEKAVYLVNYRGYGASTGMPTEETLFEDASTIFDHVSQSHSEISIIGRSLGSGVAMALAAAKIPKRLVLITPYDSIVRLAQSSFPIFPVSYILKDRYDSLSFASSISMPTLFLIAERDDVIPVQNSKNLAAAIEPSIITVTVIDDATHNTIQDFDRYTFALGQFLQ